MKIDSTTDFIPYDQPGGALAATVRTAHSLVGTGETAALHAAIDMIAEAVERGALAERERCAKLCEERAGMKAYDLHGDARVRYEQDQRTASFLAAAIRASR